MQHKNISHDYFIKILLLTSMWGNFNSYAATNAALHVKPDAKEQSTLTQAQEHFLFFQTANTATIKKSQDNSGTHTIVLHNVSPYVTRFSERPFRNAAVIPIQALLDLWQVQEGDSFKTNPPNAAISAHLVNNTMEPQTYTVVLTNPVYQAKQKTLTYTVKSLHGSPTALPDSATFNNTTVFIDDFGAICLKCFRP